MIDVTTLRFWIGTTIAWLLLCMLLLDQWFFFSPLGFITTFCLPALGWLLWWRYAPAEGCELSPWERRLRDKVFGWLRRLKTGVNRQS